MVGGGKEARPLPELKTYLLNIVIFYVEYVLWLISKICRDNDNVTVTSLTKPLLMR